MLRCVECSKMQLCRVLWCDVVLSVVTCRLLLRPLRFHDLEPAAESSVFGSMLTDADGHSGFVQVPLENFLRDDVKL